MMCSWCEPPKLEKQSEMKLPTCPEMHNDQRPTCSQKLPRPPANNNEQQNQNTTRARHETNHNKQEYDAILTRTNTFSHQKTHRCGNTTLQTRKWCQNNRTNRSRRNHLRNCLRKKTSRSDYIIDTQTKTQ